MKDAYFASPNLKLSLVFKSDLFWHMLLLPACLSDIVKKVMNFKSNNKCAVGTNNSDKQRKDKQIKAIKYDPLNSTPKKGMGVDLYPKIPKGKAVVSMKILPSAQV